ncbi:MAG: carboxypeptidase regulatory-like domain-containing protein [Bacteroidales bacterium]
MPHRGTLALFTLIVVVLLAGSAFGQEQTGSIQGTVKDASGAVLPGVTIEARSPALVGVATALTDERGTYRFPALPPGTYSVTAALTGFETAKVDGVALALGQILKVDLSLKVGGVAETVEVKGQSPLIDVKQSAAYATMEAQTLDRLPKGRDYTSVIVMAPGAQSEAKAGGEAQIDGASGSENRFIIDGMDTTALAGGTSGKPMPVDFIQQVQVKSSGYAAEFGGATGGVISAITKSGSNQVRGSAGLYYQNDSFYGSMRPLRTYSPWDNNKPLTGMEQFQTPWSYMSPVGDIGGPIYKDKLWYYFGLAYQSNRYNEDVVFIGDPAFQRRHFEWRNFAYFPNYNVSTQLTPNMRLRVSGSNQRSGERKTAPGGPGYMSSAGGAFIGVYPVNMVYDGPNAALKGTVLDRYTNATFTTDQALWDRTWNKYATDSRNDMFAANYDWILTPRVFLNATAGYFRTNTSTSPDMRGDQSVHTFRASNTDPVMKAAGFPTVPVEYQGPIGTYDNISNTGTDHNMYSRFYMNANGTWFKSWKGQHILKTGVRFERYANDVLDGATLPNMSLYWGRKYNKTTGGQDYGTYGYYAVTQTGYQGSVASNNVSFWVQDGWTVNNKLTVNAGLRLENEHVPSFTEGLPGIDFGFGQKLAPRLGFAYDLRGDSQWKFYGSFGYFYDVTKLDLARTYFGAFGGSVYYWSLDTYDWKNIQCEYTATGCSGSRLLEQFYMAAPYNVQNKALADYLGIPGMTSIDPNLLPTQTGELVGGVDHQINERTSLGVRYVHKWLIQVMEDVGVVIPGKGTFQMLTNPGYGYSEVLNPSYPSFTTPPPVRDYDAFEVRLRRRFARNWSAEVDYTYSRLYGNYSGLTSSDTMANSNALVTMGSATGTSSPNITGYYDAIYSSYDDRNQKVYGRLATDRPHVLKVWGTYDFSWGTSVGVYGIVESGLPQTSALLWGSQGYAVYYNGRNDLGRTPAITQMDLQLSQIFKLGGSRRIAIEANIINLFDSDTVTGYYLSSRSGTSPWRDTINGSDATFFGGPWDPATVVANLRASGAQIRDEKFYKQPNYYQQRREARILVKFSF